MLSTLALCDPKLSCVVEAPLEDTWAVVRDWGHQRWLTSLDGQPCKFTIVEGGVSGTTVGAVRSVQIGTTQMFEKLVAVDDEEHIMKWRLISHPGTVNPFASASYVNFFTVLSLKEVSIGNSTYVEWKGEFFTEACYAEAMQGTFERWFKTGLLSLQEYMLRQRRTIGAVPVVGTLAGPPAQFPAGFMHGGPQAPISGQTPLPHGFAPQFAMPQQPFQTQSNGFNAPLHMLNSYNSDGSQAESIRGP